MQGLQPVDINEIQTAVENQLPSHKQLGLSSTATIATEREKRGRLN